MKIILVFFLGFIAGAFCWELYSESGTHASHTASARPLADQALDTANSLKDSVAGKLAEWHLTGDDIKEDLAKAGQVVRSKARIAGDKISDARIVTVIKAKFVLDRDFSALDINVDCRDGEVTLRGTVASYALIGRAVALALDTEGVRTVVAKLTVESKTI